MKLCCGAGQGAPDFALVTADTQSSGRGRMGRKWVSTAGACLAFSLVLRPTPPETNCITLFSPLGSLAIQRVLQNNYRLPCEVKWPNDVLIYRKKVAGILVEIDWNGAIPEGIIQGIGVNISQAAVPPASDLLFPATSLEDELGYRPDRWEFLRQVLAQIKALRPLLPTGALIKEWEKHLAFAGERVRVESTVQPPQNWPAHWAWSRWQSAAYNQIRKKSSLLPPAMFTRIIFARWERNNSGGTPCLMTYEIPPTHPMKRQFRRRNRGRLSEKGRINFWGCQPSSAFSWRSSCF